LADGKKLSIEVQYIMPLGSDMAFDRDKSYLTAGVKSKGIA